MDPDVLSTGPKSAGNAPQPPHLPAELPPLLIPDHKLLRRIGKGSYGEVWLAQNPMGTYRAVKIVYRSSFRDQRPFERELSGIRKFEPISRSHEGFVDVLHVGINEAQGCFYYVMELGDDETSGQKIEPEKYVSKTLAKELATRGRLPLQESLQLGLALSLALGELHRHRLVHRDIKPSNIIYVNGVPKLADIGLVAEVNEAPSFVGTEGFIPPEGPGSPQADVFSLGKVLYEASTGKDRFLFPELPADLETWPELKGFLELNEIVLRACQNEPGRRYQTAWEMHADLLVIIHGKSVKRLRLLERRQAKLKRLASLTALVVLVLSGVSYQVYREWRNAFESRQRQIGSTVTSGIRAMDSGDMPGALPYFSEAAFLDRNNPTRARAQRLRFGSTLQHCPRLTWYQVEKVRVNDGVFTPDGQHALIAQFFGQAQLLALQTNEWAPQTLGAGPLPGLCGVACSPDGRSALTASQDGTATLWDIATRREVQRLRHPEPVFSARFSPDGLRILTSCQDGIGRVWDARTGRLERSLKHHSQAVAFANFSHDGRLIVTTSYDATAQLWDAQTGRLIGPPLKHDSWVTSAAFSPDDQKLVTGSLDHKARVWEVPTGRRIFPDLHHSDGVKSVEVSPDGRVIATASWDGTVRLWQADNQQPLANSPILRHGERVMRAAFSPEGRRLLTVCIDGSVRIWDLAGSPIVPEPKPWMFSPDGSRFLVAEAEGGRVCDGLSEKPISARFGDQTSWEKTAFSRNGRFLVSIATNSAAQAPSAGRLQVWNADTGESLAPALSASNAVAGACLSDDGRRLVTFGGMEAQVWDVLACQPLVSPMKQDEKIEGALFSPDGRQVLTRGGSKVWLWDIDTGRMAFAPLAHPQWVGHAAFSPNGAYLVTCCSDEQLTRCSARLWDTATGRQVGAEMKHADGVLWAAFSPDGQRLVTASEDFTAALWEVPTGRQLVPSLRHEHQVLAAAFSPDGQWIVTASSDKTARLWSTETGEPLAPPLRHLAGLTHARFIADGRRVVTIDHPGHTRVWPLPIDQRPVEDLLLLARLLSGGTVLPSSSWSQPQGESLEAIWRTLRLKYPADFTISAEESTAWHAFEAEQCESEGNWFAAAFHLERLVALRPADAPLSERLARAKERLKSGR